MKVKFSNSINPFGGINFVLKSLNDLGIDDLLNEQLPALAKQSKYSWSDILYTFWSIYFCGGDCIEDCDKNFKSFLKPSPLLKLCSPDRILDRFKELACEKTLEKSKHSQKKFGFSINMNLNQLNIELLKRLGHINRTVNTFDYDNTLHYNEKKDSKPSYRSKKAYHPGVAFVNDHPVYIENQDGNCNGVLYQERTLNRAFELIDQLQIKIDCFRADSASYKWEVIKLVKERVDFFYIGTRRFNDLMKSIVNIEDWQQIETDDKSVAYRGEIKYTPFKTVAKRNKEEDKLFECRLIVTKTHRKDMQIDAFTNEAYEYRSILTNDFDSPINDVVKFYHQRGKTEKEFDILKNDFGWKNMPFSKLEQNTVFLIFCAMCRNIYSYIISEYSNKYEQLKPTYRIKKFIFRFICTPAKWIRSGRQNQLIFYGRLNRKVNSS